MASVDGLCAKTNECAGYRIVLVEDVGELYPDVSYRQRNRLPDPVQGTPSATNTGRSRNKVRRKYSLIDCSWRQFGIFARDVSIFRIVIVCFVRMRKGIQEMTGTRTEIKTR
jgi:hypothetical protein